ncbi:hypothetical protein Trydic_g11233 [Trypoxylus dichotomus]
MLAITGDKEEPIAGPVNLLIELTTELGIGGGSDIARLTNKKSRRASRQYQFAAAVLPPSLRISYVVRVVGTFRLSANKEENAESVGATMALEKRRLGWIKPLHTKQSNDEDAMAMMILYGALEKKTSPDSH